MLDKTIFIIIILICFILINIFDYGYELFDINSETNLFFQPISNIFLSDNYKLNHPEITQNTQSLGNIKFNSFLYSKPTTQKIICASHKNKANCWEDNVNNCQWVHKIDGSSYCDVGPSIWP